MTTPKRIDLKLVDEAFTATPASTNEDKAKAQAAAGIREGRRRERAEQAGAMAVAAAVVEEVRELRKRPTLAEEQKHGRHRFYQGVALGVALGALAAGLGLLIMQDAIWDAAMRSFSQQAITGAVIQAGEAVLP